jgi:arsenate reductase-like glutaredoxin family protein
MNIQIFGKKKCNDTKKAERFFKERNTKYQLIDLEIKNFSKGELERVAKSIKVDELVDRNSKDFLNSNYKYMQFNSFEVLLENPKFIKTPVVCMGKESTLGFKPEIWSKWIRK